METKKEGAATWQATRSNAKPAHVRTADTSLPDWRDGGTALTMREAFASIVVGFLFVFALMWLAAAF